MPVDVIQNKDLDKDKQKQQPTLAAPPAAQKAPSSSGRFTNLQKVMAANTGNRLNQTISGGVQSAAQKSQQQLGQAQQQFGTQSQAGRFGTQEHQQQVQQALTDPVAAAKNAQQLEQFTKFRTLGASGYAGPKQLQDTQALLGSAQRAEQLGQATTSAEGRQSLLQQMAGRGGYSGGQQRLDTLFLDPRQLKASRQATRGLVGQTETAGNVAEAQARQLQSEAEAFTKGTQEKLKETETAADKPLTERFEAAKAEEERQSKAYENIQRILRGQLQGNEASMIDPYMDRQAAIAKFAMEQAINQGVMNPDEAREYANAAQQYGNLKNAVKSYASDELNTVSNPVLRSMISDRIAQPTNEWARAKLAERMGGNVEKYKNFDLNRDVAAELRNRMQYMTAQNLSKQGISTEEERAKLNALSKLGGNVEQYKEKQGEGEGYQKGSVRSDKTSILRAMGYNI